MKITFSILRTTEFQDAADDLCSRALPHQLNTRTRMTWHVMSVHSDATAVNHFFPIDSFCPDQGAKLRGCSANNINRAIT